ncbi:MAG: UDP-N-acetylglucosamine--N-acetylmuramyl-(pentapeptide) pyrophosphoryl-undecaprenol N-acetylglucosamine transferase [Parcubacteria group bacterium]|nr:UDP-N-acetylglucosamine--N-acetylmuramyl-(pentapeptide) pyrophosphoryl-undecaprenol N-acetylglucosamine transferase [Parcubacteria group bacterium]
MRILFAGGGTGGHFFPLIAVARELHALAAEKRLARLRLELMSDRPFDEELLRAEDIEFIGVPAGKMRRYVSFWNVTDILRTITGVFRAVTHMFVSLPDVIFATGGYASFPVLFAGRVFRVPIIIHESDAIPGRVNRWAAAFAARIAVSFPQAVQFFPLEKTALVGNPIRKDILGGNDQEAREVFRLESSVPVLLVLGGSQGAMALSDVLVDALPELVPQVQIIHQIGRRSFEEVHQRAAVVLEKNPRRERYHPFAFFDAAHLRNASRASTLILARSGSGIFEIAAWGKPSILVPLPGSAQDHQRENAYAYAHAGGAVVVEQKNLSPHILVSEVLKLVQDTAGLEKMRRAAESFARIDAARKVAEEIIRLGVHE